MGGETEAGLPAMRHAADVWPVGLSVLRRNVGPVAMFVFMAMMCAGAAERMGGGPIVTVVAWIGGLYGATVLVAAASLTVLARGTASGFVALADGPKPFSVAALWLCLIGASGGAIGAAVLAAVRGEAALGADADPFSIVARVIEVAPPLGAAAAMAAGLFVGAIWFGGRLASFLSQGAEVRTDGAPPRAPGLLGSALALLISAAPIGGLAIWLDLTLPSAAEAGGYWTLAHAMGEFCVFLIASLALIFFSTAFAGGSPTPRPNLS